MRVRTLAATHKTTRRAPLFQEATTGPIGPEPTNGILSPDGLDNLYYDESYLIHTV